MLRNLLVLTLLVAGCTSCASRQTPNDVPTLSDPAVAQLIVSDNGEEVGTCSVFKVGTNLALTAGHCCTEDEGVVRTYHAKGPHAVPGAELKAVRVDETHDVCVMRGLLRGAPLQLAAHDPAVGDLVWTAGYPKGVFLISSGHWSGRDEDDDAIASIAVWGGASGSPVLDSDGRVVGILRAYYPPMSNMSVIAPIEWIRGNVALVR